MMFIFISKVFIKFHSLYYGSFELIKNINISTGIYTSLLLNAKSKRKYEFNEKKEEYDITRINYNTKDYNLFDTGF